MSLGVELTLENISISDVANFGNKPKVNCNSWRHKMIPVCRECRRLISKTILLVEKDDLPL